MNLSGELKADVAQAFKGKVYALVPVTSRHGAMIGVAVANEQGYSPLYATDGLMYTDAANKELGLGIEQAARIVASTMFKKAKIEHFADELPEADFYGECDGPDHDDLEHSDDLVPSEFE